MIPFRERVQFVTADNQNLIISGVCLPSKVSPGCLSFSNSLDSYPIELSNSSKSFELFNSTPSLPAYIFISNKDFSENPDIIEFCQDNNIKLLPVQNPRDHFIHTISTNFFAINYDSLFDATPSIHPSAKIHPSAYISENVYIDSCVTVGPGCVISEGTYIGKNAIIQSNCTIGCDGVNAYNSSITRKITMMPHFSGVFIGENVYIGSRSTINRGIFRMTRVSNDCILGSNVLLGHNVLLEDKVWLSSGVLVGGGVHISIATKVGLGSTIRDNLNIGKNVNIGMGSVLFKDVPANKSLLGNPARITPALSAGPDF